MMTAVIVILLVKVLPVFRQVFRQLGLEMSGISGALLGIGETLSPKGAGTDPQNDVFSGREDFI